MVNSSSGLNIGTLMADKVMLFAIGAAVVLHVAILAVSFKSTTTPAAMMQDVANVYSQNIKLKKQDADFIAAQSQEGSGSETQKQLLESPMSSPFNSTAENPIADIKDTRKKQSAEQYMQSYLRTQLSLQKINSKENNKAENNQNNDEEAEEERILAQIATLEAQFATRQNSLTKSQKTKTFTSLQDTRESKEAAYIQRFKKRVEQIGNDHYPQAAKERALTGDVRLMVILSPKGEVKAIRLLESSGSRLLDKYAKETVRYAAPFGEFSKNMNLEEIRLIRTWRFEGGVGTVSVEES